MNSNSEMIVILCSRLCMGESIKPLESAEWSKFALRIRDSGLEPKNLSDFSKDELVKKLLIKDEFAQRILDLIGRSVSLFIELERYFNIGIKIVTRADKAYPNKLSRNLGNSKPPFFYYAGDINICDDESIGFVGSRNISETDISNVQELVNKANKLGYTIVSGGAKGVDSIATNQSLLNGSAVVEFVADSMIKKIKVANYSKAIRDGRLVVLSAVNPDGGFNVGNAMSRNKFIYTSSKATIVVKTDYNKGGTWAGAIENMRQKWSPVYCVENNRYEGNRALISQGAIAINTEWDFNIEKKDKVERIQEISIFELLNSNNKV